MAIIGDLTDYAKNTSGIRDYINGQYEHDGKDGEEVGIAVVLILAIDVVTDAAGVFCVVCQVSD